MKNAAAEKNNERLLVYLFLSVSCVSPCVVYCWFCFNEMIVTRSYALPLSMAEVTCILMWAILTE